MVAKRLAISRAAICEAVRSHGWTLSVVRHLAACWFRAYLPAATWFGGMVKGTTMRVGMLWFDDTRDAPLENIVERAIEHYTDKYGKPPNVCFVHPSALPDEPPVGEPIKILSAPDILRHHFWLGVAQDAGQAEERSSEGANE